MRFECKPTINIPENAKGPPLKERAKRQAEATSDDDLPRAASPTKCILIWRKTLMQKNMGQSIRSCSVHRRLTILSTYEDVETLSSDKCTVDT